MSYAEEEKERKKIFMMWQGKTDDFVELYNGGGDTISDCLYSAQDLKEEIEWWVSKGWRLKVGTRQGL